MKEMTPEELVAEKQAHRARQPVPPEIKAKIQAIRTRVLNELLPRTGEMERNETPDE